MSGPQFIHLQSFSRKQNKGGQSVGQVLAEAARAPEFSQHIETPKPPNLVFGITPEEVHHKHDELISNGHVDVVKSDGTSAQRGIRKDRHTLLTAVASYPLLSAQVLEGSKDRQAYQDWVELNLRWLQEMFGDRLVSVVEHMDEEHPHLHAFILPIGDTSCSARQLNPAWAEKEEAETLARKNGRPAKEAVKLGNLAYRAKGRDLQDDYFQKVGIPAGLTRTGPKRERLSRQQWKARKEAARREAELLRQMSDRLEVLDAGQVSFEAAADEKTKELAAKFELAEALMDDAQAAKAQAEYAAAAIKDKARQSIIRAVQETTAIVIKVILGVLDETVKVAVDKKTLEFKDQGLKSKIEKLELGMVLYEVVIGFAKVWERLKGKLSGPDMQNERDAAKERLEAIVSRPNRDMQP